MTPDIVIENLSVYFETVRGPVYAVRDLSTVFRAGKISGVIGESGSGKTMLALALLGCCGCCPTQQRSAGPAGSATRS